MKKIFLLIILLITIKSISAQEQPSFPYKNSFKLSLLNFANNSFVISYERGLGKSSGLDLFAGIYYYKERSNFYNHINSTIGYLSEIQYRYYFIVNQAKSNEKVWNRLFFAPYAFYHKYQVDKYWAGIEYGFHDKYDVTIYGGGLTLGYNLTLYKFSLDVYAGGGIKMFADNNKVNIVRRFSDDLINSTHQGIIPKAGLIIGFSF